MTNSPSSSAVRPTSTAPNRPPGPKGMPVLGHLVDFGRDQLGFMSRTARDYGDIVTLNFAGWPTLLLSELDAIAQVLVKDHKSYSKNRLVWRHVTALFGNGLLTSNGTLWQRQRRLASPPFAGQQLLGYDKDIVVATATVLNGWHDGQVLDVHPEMMGLTLRIVAKTLFESEVERDIAEIEHALDDLIVEIKARFRRPMVIPDAVPLPGHIRYRRAIRTIERVVSRMIEMRRASGIEGRTDFLSRMMAAKDENGRPIDDTLLRDEAITLLLAGHETTAVTLSWTSLLLGQHPEVDARLAAEVMEVLGDRAATSEDLPRLKYTEGVILESMRLYPPAWAIGRESIEPTEIGGYHILTGTTVFICPWILHHDERYFDEPMRFYPDRWMGDLARELPRFAYMPFGGGPRICIGQRFAMMEATLALATIVQRFRMEWQQDRPVTPFPSITLRPEGGVWVKLKSRSLH